MTPRLLGVRAENTSRHESGLRRAENKTPGEPLLAVSSFQASQVHAGTRSGVEAATMACTQDSR